MAASSRRDAHELGRGLAWTVPGPPVEPGDPPTVHRLHDAFLTKFSQGPVPHHENRPLRFMQGAVYDSAGHLVPSSQKLGGIGGNRHLPADPTRIRIPRQPKRLTGSWLYGGHWNQHFGHFILETITTLWPRERDLDGVVFHQYFGMPFVVETWMEFFLAELGLASVPIKVVGKQNGLAVDRLAVPGRAVVSHGYAHPEARAVWEQVARRYVGSSLTRKVYLSRTEFHARRRGHSTRRVRTDATRDRALDALFDAAGFAVVAPETLPIADQIRLVANAEVIAGSSGSALHLSAFARRGTKVLELGDHRNPHEPLAMQQVIAAVSGQPLAFVPLSRSTDGIRAQLADDHLRTSRRRSWWRR